MFHKALSLALLAVSAHGFAPMAPSAAATRGMQSSTTTALNFQVTLISDKGLNETFECDPNTFILDAAELKGVPAPYSCRAGACSSCASIVQEGEIDQSGNLFLEDSKVDQGWILSCVSYPRSDCTIKVDCENEFYSS
eukprot:scaffold26592_cov171-Skeletonema_menzelii.AAC.2